MLDLISLPDFGIDIIWEELSTSERFKFRSVCKTWRLLANRLIFNELIISDASPQILSFLPKYGSIVSRLSISELDVSLQEIEKSCGNLVSLFLKRVSFNGNSTSANSFEHLTFLSVTLEGGMTSEKDLVTWGPLFNKVPNLTTLILNEFNPLVAQTLFYYLPKLSSFRYTSAGPLLPKSWKHKHLLKLKENVNVSRKKSFINHNLRKLYIECYLPLKVDTDFILLSPENFPRLNKLTLHLFDGLLDNWQEESWPDLTYLYFSYNNTYPSLVDLIVKSCPALVHFHCHKITSSITLPLSNYFVGLKHLTKLYLDLSCCDLDSEVLEELPIQNSITELGLHFSFLNFRKLTFVNSAFPKVRRFEFIGAVHPDKNLTFQLAKLVISGAIMSEEIPLRFPWKELVVPDFNGLLIEIVRLCPMLKKLFHRFQISDIPPQEALELLKYSHLDLVIEHIPPHSLNYSYI